MWDEIYRGSEEPDPKDESFCRAEEQCVVHSKFNLHAAGSMDGRRQVRREL